MAIAGSLTAASLTGYVGAMGSAYTKIGAHSRERDGERRSLNEDIGYGTI
jgi:hypothetical protein